MEDYSSQVESPTAKKFKEEIIDKGYKYKMGAKGIKGWDEKNIDCSGAVCKVLGIKDPAGGNSAAHFHDRSKPIKESDIQDGDIITMNTEGKKIDHIGMIVIDSNTGMPFIAESSSSFNSGKIVPLQERLDSLKTKYPDLKYYFRRL